MFTYVRKVGNDFSPQPWDRGNYIRVSENPFLLTEECDHEILICEGQKSAEDIWIACRRTGGTEKEHIENQR